MAWEEDSRLGKDPINEHNNGRAAEGCAEEGMNLQPVDFTRLDVVMITEGINSKDRGQDSVAHKDAKEDESFNWNLSWIGGSRLPNYEVPENRESPNRILHSANTIGSTLGIRSPKIESRPELIITLPLPLAICGQTRHGGALRTLDDEKEVRRAHAPPSGTSSPA
uniref:Uncharacterized protein n=1 Tax=Ascaris lumbricoides TaxID=6252 RepID=A0A9J2PS55_ASCLU